MEAFEPYLKNKTFDMEKMAVILFRGENNLEAYRMTSQLFDEVPILRNNNNYFEKSRIDQIGKSIRMGHELTEILWGIDDITNHVQENSGSSLGQYSFEVST